MVEGVQKDKARNKTGTRGRGDNQVKERNMVGKKKTDKSRHPVIMSLSPPLYYTFLRLISSIKKFF